MYLTQYTGLNTLSVYLTQGTYGGSDSGSVPTQESQSWPVCALGKPVAPEHTMHADCPASLLLQRVYTNLREVTKWAVSVHKTMLVGLKLPP